MNDGIQVASRGAGGFSLRNVSPEEMDKLEAMALGHAWCMVVNGRLQSQSRWEPLPKPAADETMMPFWQPISPGRAQLELRGIETPPGAQAGIMIQSLCGYEYSPENYRLESEKLERYGFVCLRSRRGEDGRFWEVWHLPGLWSAEDELKDALQLIRERDEAKRVDTAVSFLCQHVRFGSLEVFWQRAAMVIED